MIRAMLARANNPGLRRVAIAPIGTMRFITPHAWDVTPAEARRIQADLSNRVDLTDAVSLDAIEIVAVDDCYLIGCDALNVSAEERNADAADRESRLAVGGSRQHHVDAAGNRAAVRSRRIRDLESQRGRIHPAIVGGALLGAGGELARCQRCGCPALLTLRRYRARQGDQREEDEAIHV